MNQGDREQIHAIMAEAKPRSAGPHVCASRKGIAISGGSNVTIYCAGTDRECRLQKPPAWSLRAIYLVGIVAVLVLLADLAPLVGLSPV